MTNDEAGAPGARGEGGGLVDDDGPDDDWWRDDAGAAPGGWAPDRRDEPDDTQLWDDAEEEDDARPRYAPAPPVDAEVLTLEDAARRYGFEVDRLRRRLVAGGIPGAYRIETAAGEEWRIPAASLVTLGYQPVGGADRPDPLPGAGTDAAEPTDLTGSLRTSDEPAPAAHQRPLDVARQLLDAELERVDAERARLDAERVRLDEERARLDEERARLDEERARLDEERTAFERERAEGERDRVAGDAGGGAGGLAPDVDLQAQLAFILEEVQELREAFLALAEPPDPASVEAARAARRARRAARAVRIEQALQPVDDDLDR